MSKAEWSGHIVANTVEPNDDRPLFETERQLKPPVEVLADLPDEPMDEPEVDTRHYLVEVRVGWLTLESATVPQGMAWYAREDGQAIWRKVDAHQTDEGWSVEEGDLWRSIVTDKEGMDPVPVNGQSVDALRDAYRLLITERHKGGEQA